MSSSAPTTRTFKTARQLEMDKPVKNKKPRKPIKWPKMPNKKVLKYLGVAVLVIALVFSWQYYSAQRKLNNNSNEKITKDLGKIYLLPESETPTIATVKDVEKLEGQNFFKDAQNGDKVFVYSKAGKAIIYRPSSNQVVNAGQTGN